MRINWKCLILFLKCFVPVAISIPFLFNLIKLDRDNPKVSNCLGIVLIVASYWILSPIPLVVTALFPMFLIPLLKIAPTSKLVEQVLPDTLYLFIGGFVYATAVQKWKIHSRIGIKIVSLFGLKPKLLMLGLFIGTFVLSMWIANIAAAITMLPTAQAIISKLEEMSGDPSIIRPFSRSLYQGIAYSATLGGMCTLVGTAPNLALITIAAQLFPDAPKINFSNYFEVGFPNAVMIEIAVYLYFAFFGTRGLKLPNHIDSRDFSNSFEDLGKMKLPEIIVLMLFLLLIILWVFRSNITFGSFTIKGWATLIYGVNGSNQILDGTITILMTIFLFVIHVPVDDPFTPDYESIDMDSSNASKTELYSRKWVPLITWEECEKKIPWSIVILLMSGFALNFGFIESGFSKWVGNKLQPLAKLPKVVVILSICSFSTGISNFMANSPVASIFLPIFGSIAKESKTIHPYLLLLAATFGLEAVFVLPVGTPPNLIAMTNNYVTMKDFMIFGIPLNIFAVLSISFLSYAIVQPVFDAYDFPDWA